MAFLTFFALVAVGFVVVDDEPAVDEPEVEPDVDEPEDDDSDVLAPDVLEPDVLADDPLVVALLDELDDTDVAVDELDAPPFDEVRPATFEQTGHALGPCTASIFWAMAICWSFVARSAPEAYCVPPNSLQVLAENCSPP